MMHVHNDSNNETTILIENDNIDSSSACSISNTKIDNVNNKNFQSNFCDNSWIDPGSEKENLKSVSNSSSRHLCQSTMHFFDIENDCCTSFQKVEK